MLKYCASNVAGFVVRVDTTILVTVVEPGQFHLGVDSQANRCSMPASTVRDRSGSRSGLPRKNGERLNDSSIVGSLMPSPALARSRVSPTAPSAVRATKTSEPRGTEGGAETVVVFDATAGGDERAPPRRLMLD